MNEADFIYMGENVTNEDQSCELAQAGLDDSIADYIWERFGEDWELKCVSYPEAEFVCESMKKNPVGNIHPAWSLLALMSWVACKGEWTLGSKGNLTFKGKGQASQTLEISCKTVDGGVDLVQGFTDLIKKLL